MLTFYSLHMSFLTSYALPYNPRLYGPRYGPGCGPGPGPGRAIALYSMRDLLRCLDPLYHAIVSHVTLYRTIRSHVSVTRRT